ncbi:DUF1842 domain-containing protein [Aquimarina sediminis]|uniref:DUF1842 domain-containing protein n=1 Tax=Aquimarina sediminis TaxID=2070536 RepID=UPI000CA05E27|nr:DUF1842 domain-containing protein [Aquimarina sediminis]
MSTENNLVGLFHVTYEVTIGTPEQTIVGATSLFLSLAVYTPDRSVSGIAKITQAVNPPLNQSSKINGEYTYLTVMPNNSHILVTATGFPNLNWNPKWGIGPQLQPNFELRMILEDDWQTGRANFKYLDPDGKWQEANDYYVRAVNVYAADAKPESV